MSDARYAMLAIHPLIRFYHRICHLTSVPQTNPWCASHVRPIAFNDAFYTAFSTHSYQLRGGTVRDAFDFDVANLEPRAILLDPSSDASTYDAGPHFARRQKNPLFPQTQRQPL